VQKKVAGPERGSAQPAHGAVALSITFVSGPPPYFIEEGDTHARIGFATNFATVALIRFRGRFSFAGKFDPISLRRRE
jgi:hypothetical protein